MTEQRNTVCCGENTERKASEKKTGRRKGFRRLGGILMLFFMLFLAGGTAQAKNVTLRFSGVRSYTYANQALKLVNQARARAGKPKLTMGSRLQEDAMKRAEEIAVYFSHVRPNGESCFSAFTESYARGRGKHRRRAELSGGSGGRLAGFPAAPAECAGRRI